MSIEELVHRSQQGCRASFAELVHRYTPRLLTFLSQRTKTPQDAEDLVQETLIRAYRNVCRYDNSWKFSTWLFTIARRLAYSSYRGSHSSAAVRDVESTAPGPAELLTRYEERQGLWTLAKELSENQYQVLWLRYAEDMSIKEIAKVVNKSQMNVKVLLYRARLSMAKRLQQVPAERKIRAVESEIEEIPGEFEGA